MKNIYGRDHIGIDPQVLGNRIKLITHLLTQMQKSAIDQNVATEVIKRIRARMDSVPGIIQRKFADQDEEIKPGCVGTRTTAARNHKNILKINGNSKTRSGTRKKRHIQLSPEKFHRSMILRPSPRISKFQPATLGKLSRFTKLL